RIVHHFHLLQMVLFPPPDFTGAQNLDERCRRLRGTCHYLRCWKGKRQIGKCTGLKVCCR
uniref:Beta-defensin-like domain-containing protein n=1 Tax=Podarcis muralis TaxID=64176 RepID=A0A670HZD1_PODMU